MEDHLTRHIATGLIAAVAMLSCLAAGSAADLTRLRCEYRDNPLGIDAEKPRLSWMIEDPSSLRYAGTSRGRKQTAYQVVVASTPELIAQDRGDRPGTTRNVRRRATGDGGD